ncbi:MAG: AarF/UbiB family protein [Verrucomicrobiota bacterium]
MKISLKPQHLKRYKEIARLLIKYANLETVEHFGLEESPGESDQKPPKNGAPKPQELAHDLEAMGPTFIKLGQILSSRPDLLPEPYLKALARLQDDVQPFPYEDVERIIQSELGIRISKAFLEFDPVPIAAASLAQVHRARLRNRREVVVKVQRPDVRKQIADDIEVLDEIVSLLEQHTAFGKRYQVAKIFGEFRRVLIQELDYQREAATMLQMRESLRAFDHLRIPEPIPDYTTRTVLTMDYVRGVKITDLSPIIRTELDGAKLADELFRAYLKQVLVDGVFHADPHPGNVLLTEDNRVALLDLGMIGRISPEMQVRLLKLLLAVAEGRSDEAATLAIGASETTPDFNETDFRRKIAQVIAEQQNTTLRQLDIGRTLLDLGRSAGQSGLYVPTELTMLGKALLQLDEIGRFLDESFNPNEAVRQHALDILNQRIKKDLTPHNLFAGMLDLKDFLGHLPSRLNRILDVIANAELELKVKSREVDILLDGFQKIANRITTGLILAALIIGAALLMQVQTSFLIFGYPGLAMVFFLTAAGIGLWLVFNILLRDRSAKHHRRDGNE